jgi:hypothetical protein
MFFDRTVPTHMFLSLFSDLIDSTFFIGQKKIGGGGGGEQTNRNVLNIRVLGSLPVYKN